MAKLLIFIGLALTAVGLLWHFFPGALNWFGRLPGDIRIERPGGSFLFPITSMLLVSVVLTVIVNVFFRR